MEIAVDFVRHTFYNFMVLFFCSGQIKLCNASLLIVGAGGLGCPVAQYLAAAGVGNPTFYMTAECFKAQSEFYRLFFLKFVSNAIFFTECY